jgi:predicted transcriptional regulator
MAQTTLALQSEFEAFTERHASLKKKWLDKRHAVNELISSATGVSSYKRDQPIQHAQSEQNESNDDERDFETILLDQIACHAPISAGRLATLVSRRVDQVIEQLERLNSKRLIALDPYQHMVLSIGKVT